MERTLREMEEQLEAWGRKIDLMVAGEPPAGHRLGIDALQRMDELKLLCAIARERLDGFKAGAGEEAAEHSLRKRELEKAWRELEAAVKKSLP